MGREPITFVPSRVDGLDAVTRVTVHPDRIVFTVDGSDRAYDFHTFGRPIDSILQRCFDKICFRKSWRVVGERDWFHSPPDRFFRFFTEPQITLYMPVDDVENYPQSIFCRIQRVWRSERVETFDLG